MKRAGLTSVTVGIETPSDPTLQNYRRQTIDQDRQHAFIAACRELGIRTVAGFMIGFPEDTEQSIRCVRDYAIALGPTFANFNVVTPYPGTGFFEHARDRLGEIDYNRFNVYTPMLKYDHLTPERIEWLLAKCFRRYYFRWQYLRENAALLWPGLRRWGLGATRGSEPQTAGAGSAAPQPLAGLQILESEGRRSDGPHRLECMSGQKRTTGLGAAQK